MKNRITKCIEGSIKVKELILTNNEIINNIEIAVAKSVEAFRNNRKMLLCGNGGSAADAQHIAAELSGRFYKDRKPLSAEALHVNTSFLTAVANDYGYDNVYSRMVEAIGCDGDILIAISTSGDSANVINAIKKSQELEMLTIGFTGADAGAMHNLCDVIIKIPSNDIPRIQESHILIGHIMCQLIEEELF